MAHTCRHITAGMIDVVIEDARLDRPIRATVPRLLKLPRFDLVFDARTRVATVLAARLVLRPKKFFNCLPGFLFASARPRGQWSRPQNMAARMMAMFEAATGKPAPKTTDIPLSNEARILAERLLPTGPRYLGFAAGASGPEKCWPIERFAALANSMSGHGYVPVFLLGPAEQDWVETLREKVPGAMFPEQAADAVAPSVDRIERFIAICKRLSAAVTNCSGPAHALGLAGVPIVSLHGPTRAERWAAWVEPKRTLQVQSLGYAQLADLPVDIVLGELESLLQEASERGRVPNP